MQEAKRSPLLDSLKIVGLAIMACYVCRVWPMVIFLVIYGLAVITRTLVKSRKAKTAKLCGSWSGSQRDHRQRQGACCPAR